MTKYDEFLKELMNDYGTWFLDEKRLKEGKMTDDLYPYEELFTPIQINHLKVKNRICMGPMGNISMCEETGRPNQKMIEYFIQRAKGGTGLLTSGLVHVSQGIDHTVTEQGDLTYFPRIDRSRSVWSGWRDIAHGVHSFGSRFFIQLSAGMGRVGSPECLVNKHKFPISASTNPNFYISSLPSIRVRTKKAKKIVKAFGQAAVDAKTQTIDGVYLHGHEGYLLEQMTNPAYNRRKFGRYSDWQQFGIDIVKEIRKRCGDKYPIWYRIDLSLALNATYGEKMKKEKILKKFQDERTIEMTLDYMENLVKAGVDMFDVDLGGYDNFWLPHPPNGMPPGCYLDVAKLVKDHFENNNIKSNQGLDVPVVAVGKLGYPDLAEQALRDEKCDMIMLARPLLADPDWAHKAYQGNITSIRPCIGDQEACFHEFLEGGHPQCAVNPRTGYEDVIPEQFPQAKNKKNIAIIGAGPAGSVCALTAAKRGHQVDLFDKNEKAGGMVITGSVPSSKYDLKNYVDYLNNELEKRQEKGNLNIQFEKEVTIEDIENKDYDTIIFGLGCVPKKLKVPGAEKSHVIQAIDFFKNPEIAEDAKKIVVIGGGIVGCEAAHYLAYEMNKEVKIVEALPYIMKHVFTANRGYLLHYFEEKGVELINHALVQKIEDNSIKIEQNMSKSVPNPYNTWQPILPENVENPFEKTIHEKFKERVLEADLVITAIGVDPNEDLFRKAYDKGLDAEIFNIGDSFEVGKVFEAVKSGFSLGRRL